MRYKVPQNIDIQDRIIGPLTMIQFLYAVIGGGVCYSIFMAAKPPLSYILIAPTALFTAALVFVKINERPFLDFFLAVVQYLSAPKERVWHRLPTDNIQITIYKSHKNKEVKAPVKQITRDKISALAQKLDTE